MISFCLWSKQLCLEFNRLLNCHRLLPGLAALILISGESFAQSSSQPSAKTQNPIRQMAQLNATGRALQSYQIGTQLLSQLEGEPAFDLHYGVAAIDSGYASQGAFALERVLMYEPANDYARLELARAYFILEEDDRAKAEFQTVLDADPPQDVVDNVRPYLRAIESRAAWRKTTYTASIELGGGYDSNILAAPDNDTFFIPLIGDNASVGNTADPDSFFQVKADASVSHPIRYGLNVFLSGNASKRENDSDQVNITSLGVQTGIIYRNGAHNVRAALQADTLDVDSENYRDSVGLNASWQYSLSPKASVTVFGQVSDQSYNNLDLRDALYAIGGLSYRYQFIAPLKPVATISVTAGKEDADNDEVSGALQNTERDVFGASASLTLFLGNNLSLQGGLRFENSEFAAPGLNGQSEMGPAESFIVRDDDLFGANLGLTWGVTDNLILKLDGSINNRDSSIDLYEYDRNQITLSARYRY